MTATYRELKKVYQDKQRYRTMVMDLHVNHYTTLETLRIEIFSKAIVYDGHGDPTLTDACERLMRENAFLPSSPQVDKRHNAIRDAIRFFCGGEEPRGNYWKYLELTEWIRINRPDLPYRLDELYDRGDFDDYRTFEGRLDRQARDLGWREEFRRGPRPTAADDDERREAAKRPAHYSEDRAEAEPDHAEAEHSEDRSEHPDEARPDEARPDEARPESEEPVRAKGEDEHRGDHGDHDGDHGTEDTRDTETRDPWCIAVHSVRSIWTPEQDAAVLYALQNADTPIGQFVRQSLKTMGEACAFMR